MSLIDRDLATILEVVTNIRGHQEMVYKHFAELHTHTLHIAKTQKDIDALLASEQPVGSISDFVVDAESTNRLAPIDPQDPAYDAHTLDDDDDVIAGENLEETDEEDEGALVDNGYQSEASARVVKRRFSGGATVVIDHGIEDTEVFETLTYLQHHILIF